MNKPKTNMNKPKTKQKRTSNRLSFEWGTSDQDTFSQLEEIRPEFKGQYVTSEM